VMNKSTEALLIGILGSFSGIGVILDEMGLVVWFMGLAIMVAIWGLKDD